MAPPTTLSLQPVHLVGHEGLHSSVHSFATVRGDLELRGARATLSLVTTWETSFVYCSRELQEHSVQACADPTRDRPHTSTTTDTLTGDARWDGPTMIATLAGPRGGLTLRCTHSYFGLTCAIDGREGTYVFARPETRQLALAPTTRPGGPAIAGALAITGDTARVSLSADGRTPVEKRGHVFRSGAGLVVEAGGPTGRVSLVCQDTDATLACELTVDPEVFQRPAFWGPVVLVDVNARAHAPARAQMPMHAAPPSSRT